MAWVAVDKDGSEFIYEDKPERYIACWRIWRREFTGETMNHVFLPKGSIKKLIGKELSWSDEPVELKGD